MRPLRRLAASQGRGRGQKARQEGVEAAEPAGPPARRPLLSAPAFIQSEAAAGLGRGGAEPQKQSR